MLSRSEGILVFFGMVTPYRPQPPIRSCPERPDQKKGGHFAKSPQPTFVKFRGKILQRLFRSQMWINRKKVLHRPEILEAKMWTNGTGTS